VLLIEGGVSIGWVGPMGSKATLGNKNNDNVVLRVKQNFQTAVEVEKVKTLVLAQTQRRDDGTIRFPCARH
jgi:hypothetical protein